MDPENKSISSLCELMLYGADRAQHLNELVLPSLEVKKTVLCDRFIDSTTAYQGYARGLDMDLIFNIHNIVIDRKPDITILFDLDPEIGLKRTFKALNDGNRSYDETRFEQETLEFHKKVRQGYLNIANNEKDRFIIIDASLSKDEVYKNVIMNLQDRIY